MVGGGSLKYLIFYSRLKSSNDDELKFLVIIQVVKKTLVIIIIFEQNDANIADLLL